MVPPVAAAPSYKLYTPGAVGLATFLGSPIAGTVVMAINYKRLGNRSAAGKALALGFVGTVALGTVAALLPQALSLAPSIGAWVGMNSIAKSLQGEVVEEHTSRGGQLASNWKAAGIAVVVCIMLVAAIAISYLTLMPQSHKLEFLPGKSIRYSGEATESDARLLGGVLQKDHYFVDNGHNMTVLLEMSHGLATISFVMSEKGWTDEQIHTYLRKITGDAADAGFGKPIELRVVDPELEEHWTSRIE
jgi:hypothetical protein